MWKRFLRQPADAPFATSEESSLPSSLLTWGEPVVGDLYEWIVGNAMTYPEDAFGSHCVIVGASRSGKTETLLRLAYGAAHSLGWQVIFIDAKGDYATAARFYLAMKRANVSNIKVFPVDAYNGWRGDGQAMLNRLLAIETYSEPYYANMAKLMLRLAISSPRGLPHSHRQLLDALKLDFLQEAYQQTDDAYSIRGIHTDEALGVYHRYDAFFSSLAGKLDGSWAYEDVDAAYLLINGLALKDEALSLGRFFVEDMAQYVVNRKDPNRKTLFIIDEFSAINTGTDAANLFERMRSFGAAVIISSQSYAGLGSDDTAQRMLGAANGLIIHRCSDPEELIKRAGTRRHIERSIQLGPDGATGAGSARVQETYRIAPNQVRQLRTGEAFIVANGLSHLVKVNALPDEKEATETLANELRIQATPKTPQPEQPKTANEKSIDF